MVQLQKSDAHSLLPQPPMLNTPTLAVHTRLTTEEKDSQIMGVTSGRWNASVVRD